MRRFVLSLSVLILVSLFALGCQQGDGGGDTGGDATTPATQEDG